MAKRIGKELVKQLEERAAAERGAGGRVEINNRYGYVAVTMSDGGEYYFQGEEAEELLAEVPNNINDGDYILAIAQNW